MKKVIFGILLWCCLTVVGSGQVIDDDPELPVQERVEAARKAFITDRLKLTSRESEQFWAVHNEFEAERRVIRDRYRPARNVEYMSDAEADAFINDRFKMEEELIALNKTYYQKFKGIISSKRIALYYKAEREFRQLLIRQYREQRNNRRD